MRACVCLTLWQSLSRNGNLSAFGEAAAARRSSCGSTSRACDPSLSSPSSFSSFSSSSSSNPSLALPHPLPHTICNSLPTARPHALWPPTNSADQRSVLGPEAPRAPHPLCPNHQLPVWHSRANTRRDGLQAHGCTSCMCTHVSPLWCCSVPESWEYNMSSIGVE